MHPGWVTGGGGGEVRDLEWGRGCPGAPQIVTCTLYITLHFLLYLEYEGGYWVISGTTIHHILAICTLNLCENKELEKKY